jgi:hypothetical protein
VNNRRNGIDKYSQSCDIQNLDLYQTSFVVYEPKAYFGLTDKKKFQEEERIIIISFYVIITLGTYR